MAAETELPVAATISSKTFSVSSSNLTVRVPMDLRPSLGGVRHYVIQEQRGQVYERVKRYALTAAGAGFRVRPTSSRRSNVSSRRKPSKAPRHAGRRSGS